MGAPKPKTMFKPGDSLFVKVDEILHVRESDPCNKNNCMLTRAFGDNVVKTYGGKVRDYKVKSTNHGITFVMKDRKYVAVFDTKTAARIYKYDKTYRATRSKEKARAGVRSFTARIMIESSSQVVKWPTMSAETKTKLRSLDDGFGRDLSM